MFLIQAIDGERNTKEHDFSAISHQVSELCRQCENEKDSQILQEQFKALSSRYDTLHGLVDKRTQVCQQWTVSTAERKSIESEMKHLQQAIKSDELSQAEITESNEKISNVETDLQRWDDNRKDLNDLVVSSQMTIKDRATMDAFSFEADLQSLWSEFATTRAQVESRQAEMSEVSKLVADFDTLQRDLKDSLSGIVMNVDESRISESTLGGIQEWGRQIQSLEELRKRETPKYKEMRALGRQLIAADVAGQTDTEAAVGNLTKQWQTTEELLSQRIDTVAAVTTLWSDFDETVSEITQVLCHVDGVMMGTDHNFAGRDEVKVTLTDYKVSWLVF